MKITAIKTSNFLGARNVDAKLSKPICLFAGKNFSGKSSLQEAVRMALTGESVLVSLNKYYRKLVTEGTEYGFSVDELIASKRAEIYAGIDEKWRKTSFDEKEIIGSNTAQKKVLARAGWAMLATFASSKTGEKVELWGWNVKKAEA